MIGSLLPNIAFKGKFGVMFAPLINLIYKSDIALTATGEILEAVKISIDSLTENKDRLYEMNKQYGP